MKKCLTSSDGDLYFMSYDNGALRVYLDGKQVQVLFLNAGDTSLIDTIDTYEDFITLTRKYDK
jgi:hypothetical protein